MGVIVSVILLALVAWWVTSPAPGPAEIPATPLTRHMTPSKPAPISGQAATAAAPQIRDTPAAASSAREDSALPADMLAAIERARAAAEPDAMTAQNLRNLPPEEAARQFQAAVQLREKPAFGLSNTPFLPSGNQ